MLRILVFYAFGESPLFTIYCEAKTRLDGWSENWQSGALVIWDYKSYTNKLITVLVKN